MTGEREGAAWKAALVGWVLVIWIHSLIPGDVSSSESGFFLPLVRPLFELLGVRDPETTHFLVRKAGHFLEYLVLGAIALRVLRPRPGGDLRRLMAFLGVWACVPCVDETIQLFTPGRVGAIGDVLVDMSGFAVGALVALVVAHLRRGRR